MSIIPPNSRLAERLKARYYTTSLRCETFPGRPYEPVTLDQGAWDAYYEAHRAYSEARRAWKLAGEPDRVKHRKDRQEEFRNDLLAALELPADEAGVGFVIAAEVTAKECGDYDFEGPLDEGDLEQTILIAARFAKFMRST
jgi:hypothetical protein